jgi:hypothetical protein
MSKRNSTESTYQEKYDELIEQGVQEAEARDRASFVQHPPIDVDPDAPFGVSPAERVRLRSVAEREPAIKAARADAEKTAKRIVEARKARGESDPAKSRADIKAEKEDQEEIHRGVAATSAKESSAGKEAKPKK